MIQWIKKWWDNRRYSPSEDWQLLGQAVIDDIRKGIAESETKVGELRELQSRCHCGCDNPFDPDRIHRGPVFDLSLRTEVVEQIYERINDPEFLDSLQWEEPTPERKEETRQILRRLTQESQAHTHVWMDQYVDDQIYRSYCPYCGIDKPVNLEKEANDSSAS